MITKLLKIIFILTISINNLLFGLEKVSLQLEWKHQFEFAGFYAAVEKGYYEDIGYIYIKVQNAPRFLNMA